MQFATKASWFKPGGILWISYLANTDVSKTSSRRPKNITTSYDETKRRLIYLVLKTSNLLCLEDVWFTTS